MDLGKYIHQLLKHRNEVYVKGLGVFKRIHTPSVFDQQKGVYLPPVTYLEFDSKASTGVDFIDYIQQSTQSSRQVAEADVQEAVLNLLENIKDNGSATLNHVGQLIKHGQSIVFKAEDISGFQLQPIEGTASPAKEIIPVEEPAISEKQEIETNVEELEDQNAEEMKEESVEDIFLETPATNKSKWYLWAALAAIVVIAGLFYVNHTNNLKKETVKADSILNAGIVEPDTTVKNTNQDTTAKVISNTADSSGNGKKIYNPLIPANHHFQIVIGTHGTLAQAYEQAESFNKAGVESVRVIPSNLANNKKKVIWDSYETKEQVDSALRYVRKHYVADAWSQKIK